MIPFYGNSQMKKPVSFNLGWTYNSPCQNSVTFPLDNYPSGFYVLSKSNDFSFGKFSLTKLYFKKKIVHAIDWMPLFIEQESTTFVKKTDTTQKLMVIIN